MKNHITQYIIDGKIQTERHKMPENEIVPYKSFDEALLDLTSIDPCDLTSKQTSQQEAVAFCKKVMTILLRCEKLSFKDKQIQELSETLKTLGATTYENANEKFIADKKKFGEAVLSKGDIQFPLSVFTNIIDNNPESFRYGFSKAVEGGEEHSWIGEWLKTQNQKEQSRNFNN